jgi:hypothetical protein
LPPKKSMLSGFEIVSGLADGASVMPAKWNKPVFSLRFYEGRISRPPLHISSRAAPRITFYRHCGLMAKPKRAFLVLLARVKQQSRVLVCIAPVEFWATMNAFAATLAIHGSRSVSFMSSCSDIQ